MDDYEHKYHKYKKKYNQLKLQIGSADKSSEEESIDMGKCQVIPKKELVVYELKIPDRWKFRQQFPKAILNAKPENLLPEKIWFIKKTIRFKTNYNDKKIKLDNYILPVDLCCFKSCLDSNELDKLHQIFGKLFQDYKHLDIPRSYQADRGLTYLFTGDQGKTQYAGKTLEFMKSYNTDLYKLMIKIMKNLALIYGIKDDQVNYLSKYVQIVILEYKQDSGIWMHIDNVARYDQGPIVTISIGPEKIYYDFTPTLLYKNTELKPIRIEVDNGDLVIMDGSSRMEWAHGLPYDVPFDKTKYTIMLKADKFGAEHLIKNKILGIDITTTKRLCHIAKNIPN
ncbi:MAG: DNA repair protein [Edafosvirus sp.]|uniref:DNA repair protein n=1 Tax=Edafosvirus sp. TaxID=2487765 RepID=A0A3G4ZWK5_9VIRU|nr:MAG: DNA repair protein [Edafosvirus sp.]